MGFWERLGEIIRAMINDPVGVWVVRAVVLGVFVLLIAYCDDPQGPW